MITVAEARARLLALVSRLPDEQVPLGRANGRVLARDLAAAIDQPPFSNSAMDGYAVLGDPTVGDRFHVIGEAAAGHPFGGPVGPGEAVRIFTGAPVPNGATRVVIQEDVTRSDDVITLTHSPGAGTHLRPAGADFERGHILPAGKLRPIDLALAAAMGFADLPVRRAPRVAILMTGDELATPGTALTAGQIYASNGYAIRAMLEEAGAICQLLPLVSDRHTQLRQAFDLAGDADLVITIGGASVGDHDLVADAAQDAGMSLAFHKVRMRPGKPLLAGRLGNATLVGLPGNPVSSIVCTIVFILPMVRAMLGQPSDPVMRHGALAAPIDRNGPREHYMRARMTDDGLQVFERQDSSLLSVLSQANALVVRPPDDEPRKARERVSYLPL